MRQKTHKKMSYGNSAGVKLDRFRNSRFETVTDPYVNDDLNNYRGVSHADINTLGGMTAENRGRRGSQLREDNPFENGKVDNWAQKKGWDDYYDLRERSFRKHGGSLIHHDDGGHTGLGPRGYTRQDDRIFDDVCEVLTRNADVDAAQIEVKVDSGIVTLAGKVEDRSMKKFAGRIIENISGVKDVHNLLEFER